MSMNKKLSKIFVASLCLNAAALLAFGGLAYRKRGAIKERLAGLANNAGPKTEELAKAMNQEAFKPAFGKCGQGEKTVRVAFVGNSLTLHGIAPGIGWPRESGMAASSLENDYVHKLAAKIAQSKNVSVEFAAVNVADFERDFDSFDSSRLKAVEDFSADYVVFQLGENVPTLQSYDSFQKKYVGLIRRFDGATTIVCLPFWFDKNKNAAITSAALETKSFLVDLSHLDGILDAQNYAKSEAEWKHKGVGLHPGDVGMEKISDNLFSVFNALIK